MGEFCHSKRNDKGSSSDKRKMILGGIMEIPKGVKSIRKGRYEGKYKY